MRRPERTWGGANRFYPYRISYVIECFLPREGLPANGGKLSYVNCHELLSVSVCSNVPGFAEPVCLIRDGTVRELADRFVARLTEIAETVERLDVIRALVARSEAAENRWRDRPFSNKWSC